MEQNPLQKLPNDEEAGNQNFTVSSTMAYVTTQKPPQLYHIERDDWQRLRDLVGKISNGGGQLYNFGWSFVGLGGGGLGCWVSMGGVAAMEVTRIVVLVVSLFCFVVAGVSFYAASCVKSSSAVAKDLVMDEFDRCEDRMNLKK